MSRIIYNNLYEDYTWVSAIKLNDGNIEYVKVDAHSYDEVNKDVEQYIRQQSQQDSNWNEATIENIQPYKAGDK